MLLVQQQAWVWGATHGVQMFIQLSTGSTRSGRGSRFPLGVHGPAVSQAENLIVI